MMRLRHHGNMLGMGYMGLPPPPPVSQQGFTPLTASAAAHVAASPGLNSDGVQSSNDTPPHTPPTLKSSSGGVATSAMGQFGGFNGLHNGYSQTSSSPNVSLGGGGGGGVVSAASAAVGDTSAMSNYSKVLMFNSSMNNASSFKMM